MNSLFRTDGLSIPSLYVKSATSTWSIRSVFQQARYMSPCLLIFEDIDTVVTDNTRSYFFNEVDVSHVSPYFLPFLSFWPTIYLLPL